MPMRSTLRLPLPRHRFMDTLAATRLASLSSHAYAKHNTPRPLTISKNHSNLEKSFWGHPSIHYCLGRGGARLRTQI